MASSSRARPHDSEPGLCWSPDWKGCRFSGRLWLEKDGKTLLAWGRVVLLERIDELGSILAAARSMGMGYRHAWNLVDQMNRESPRPLVRKKTGGRGGGGSELTAEGRAAVASFWKLVDRFRAWMARQNTDLWPEGDGA